MPRRFDRGSTQTTSIYPRSTPNPSQSSPIHIPYVLRASDPRSLRSPSGRQILAYDLFLETYRAKNLLCQGMPASPGPSLYIYWRCGKGFFSTPAFQFSVRCVAVVIIAHAPSQSNTCETHVYRREWSIARLAYGSADKIKEFRQDTLINPPFFPFLFTSLCSDTRQWIF